MRMLLTALIVLAGLSSVTGMREIDDRADFYYSGDDDNEAADLLRTALRRTNSDWVVSGNGDVVVLEIDDSFWRLEPKTSRNALDRIVLTKIFAGKSKGNYTDAQCLGLMNTLNSDNNAIKFYVDADGDLIATYQVTFSNLLKSRDLSDARSAFDAAIGFLVARHTEEIEAFFK